jgi:hypothetical protein
MYNSHGSRNLAIRKFEGVEVGACPYAKYVAEENGIWREKNHLENRVENHEDSAEKVCQETAAIWIDQVERTSTPCHRGRYRSICCTVDMSACKPRRRTRGHT